MQMGEGDHAKHGGRGRTDFRISGDSKDAPYNLMLSESATTRFDVPFKTKTAELQRRLLEHIRKALRPARKKSKRA